MLDVNPTEDAEAIEGSNTPIANLLNQKKKSISRFRLFTFFRFGYYNNIQLNRDKPQRRVSGPMMCKLKLRVILTYCLMTTIFEDKLSRIIIFFLLMAPLKQLAQLSQLAKPMSVSMSETGENNYLFQLQGVGACLCCCNPKRKKKLLSTHLSVQRIW